MCHFNLVSNPDAIFVSYQWISKSTFVFIHEYNLYFYLRIFVVYRRGEYLLIKMFLCFTFIFLQIIIRCYFKLK